MPRKDGKLISVSSTNRWAFVGRCGVVLRTLMVGGTRCTCDAWAMEFFQRLTGDAPFTPEPRRTPHRRQKQHERAELELAREGF
jgi:hypothetical protein